MNEEVFDPDYDVYEPRIRESIDKENNVDRWCDCPVWEIGESYECFRARMREYYNN